jgi:acyl carrier protein
VVPGAFQQSVGRGRIEGVTRRFPNAHTYLCLSVLIITENLPVRRVQGRNRATLEGSEELRMDREEIRQVVKGLIAKVTDLPTDKIDDNASFRDDLELDSLALIEISVHVDHAYKLRLTEEEMSSLGTVEDAVNMVIKKHTEQGSAAPGS